MESKPQPFRYYISKCRIRLRGSTEPLEFRGYMLLSKYDSMFLLRTDDGKYFYFPIYAIKYIELLE